MSDLFWITWPVKGKTKQGGPFPNESQAASGLKEIGKQELKLRGEKLDEFLSETGIWRGNPQDGGIQVGSANDAP
jgi:hypothetical protein